MAAETFVQSTKWGPPGTRDVSKWNNNNNNNHNDNDNDNDNHDNNKQQQQTTTNNRQPPLPWI